MQTTMGLYHAFIGSPQVLTSVSIRFILVDATGQKHPVPMNVSSFEVRILCMICHYPEITLSHLAI